MQTVTLPAEAMVILRFVIRGRFFSADINGRMEEFDASANEETLAFEVMGRFFGCPLDELPGIDPLGLPMAAFDREVPRRWWPLQRGNAR
jgi:hypothetical protein